MICMRRVDCICFSLAYIRRIRFSLIIISFLIIGMTIFPNKLLDKGIRAGSIVWSIGKRDDVVIAANGEAFDPCLR